MTRPHIKLGSNLGLKLLALALAIVIYYTLKNESTDSHSSNTNDRTLFQSH